MTNIPNPIIQGDTIRWIDSNLRGISPLTGEQILFVPGIHVLTHAIRGAVLLDVVATASGNDYESAISSVQSAALLPGLYYWQAFINLPSLWRVTIATGSLQVGVDLASTPANYDGRSETQIQLDAVTNAITTLLAGGAVQSYSIKGRNLSRYGLAELMQLQAQLRARLMRERGGNGRVGVRFDSPR
jgi:hypothetical protein